MFKLICRVLGHKRGKRVAGAPGRITLECPRCRSRWERKERVKK